MDPLKYLATRSTTPRPRLSDQFLRNKFASSKDLYNKDLVGHFGCVNALEFSHGLGNYLVSGGDDRRVLLWDVEKALSDIGQPSAMKGEHNSNIFCLAFDVTNSTLFSGGNDEQVLVHDLTTGATKDVFLHDDAVYGLSPDPVNPHVFASSCDDGRVLIYDTRDSTGEPFCLANYTSSMHSVMYNPVEPRLLATANAKEGVGLWDVRKPKSCVLRYGGSYVQQSCMSVRFNQHGDKIIALRRRLPPVLYKIDSNVPACEFDHSGYYNSCTMKSVTFAGDLDQYVISGSDEFNLYMWAVPEDLSERLYINSAHMVLKGHRSIVNQVRFNPANHLIVSSGVEKVIKTWSPYKLPAKQPNEGRITKKGVRHRPIYSHEEYINLVLENGHVMSHDYSHESTEEDPRMIAFFDSLVQRELEGISSDDSLSSNEEALFSRIVQLSQSDIDTDDSLNDVMNEENSDGETNFSPFTIAFASVMASQAADGNDRFPRLNTALETSERMLAPPVVQAEDIADNIPNESLISEQDTGSCNISKLVQKKKLELRHSIQQKLKDCSATVSSSSNSDVSDSSDGGQSDVDDTSNTVKTTDKQTKKEKESENSVSETTKYLLEKMNECRKQSQVKLKRLRSLRQCVLNSDSDMSDVEHKDNQFECVTFNPPSSSINEQPEKVKFKKFKRRNSESFAHEERERYKSGESPDLGPYLQRTGGSSHTNSETRKTGEDLSCKKGKKHSPHESLTGKGMVKNQCDFDKSKDKPESNQHESPHSHDEDSDSERDSSVRSRQNLSRETGHSSHRNISTKHHRARQHRSKMENSQHAKTSSRHESSSRSNTADRIHRLTSPSPTTSDIKLCETYRRHDKYTEDHTRKHRKPDHGHKHSSTRHNNHSSGPDGERPSCSYNSGQSKDITNKHKDRSEHKTSDSETNRNKDRSRHKASDSETNRNKDRSRHKASDSEGESVCLERKKRKDSDSEDDQPTWSEFKRFKNRLERARHRYKEHKKFKKQRRHSDDTNR